MRKIYIVRHGEPDFPGGVSLSARGREQAAADACFFDSHPITAIWSSPLRRAVETAELMTRGRYPINIHNDLREAYIGSWEGLSPEEIRRRFPGAWEARQLDMSIPPGGGEDYGDAGARFEAALREIVGRTDGDIAVAAHQAVTCGFFCRITGRPIARWSDFAHDYGAINEVHFDGGRFIPPIIYQEE